MPTKTIMGYRIDSDDQWHKVSMPSTEYIKTVHVRGSRMEFFLEQGPGTVFVTREFKVFWSGYPIDLEAKYIGTGYGASGMAYHLYQRMPGVSL